jgi:hypothetical protein
MGLFDTIYVHESLIPAIPELQQRGIVINAQDDLQTKDLDCAMDEYHVGVDGKLMLRKAEYETVDTPGGIFSFALKEVSHEMVHVDTTCEANCCYYRQGRRRGDEDIWVDLKLVFVHGMLESVEPTNINITPSTPRIVQMEQLTEEIARRNQDPVIQVRRKLAIICGRVASFFNKLQYSLLRH